MEKQKSPPLAVNSKEAARLIGVSVRTLMELTYPKGPIKSFRIVRQHRYRIAELNRYLVQAEKQASRQEAE